MRSIPINHGEFYAIVDDEDYEALATWTWQASSRRGMFGCYAERTQWGKEKQIRIRMHREILNAPKGIQVDHINGNGLDNRKQNLRLCTNWHNQGNRRPNRNNRSGYKGVTLRKYPLQRPWRAEITFNRKNIHLGMFATPEDAARAYDLKAKELWGDFARLNLPA